MATPRDVDYIDEKEERELAAKAELGAKADGADKAQVKEAIAAEIDAAKAEKIAIAHKDTK